MRILFLIIACVACSAATQSTPQSQLAARIAHASTRRPCLSDTILNEPCLDDQGLVWSACAWNSCGTNKSCREEHQDAVSKGSCGGTEWPVCQP